MPVRCLLVDDSEEFLSSARALLEGQGVEVVGAATSGVEAVRLAAELEPDVTLVDVQLGDEDGLAVARDVAAVSTTRVVLISTHSEDDLAELIAGVPVAGFVAKTALSGDAIRRFSASSGT